MFTNLAKEIILIHFRKWKANATGVSRIAVHTSSERGLVATAESNIKLWDLSSQKTLIKFTADRVTNLQYEVLLYKNIVFIHCQDLPRMVNICFRQVVIE
jgi:hypothetical protein